MSFVTPSHIQVAAVRALLARGGDFYPEVLPVKRMGYVDYDEVRMHVRTRVWTYVCMNPSNLL